MMRKTLSSFRRNAAIGVYLLLLVMTSGCDTLDLGGGDTITLTTTVRDICFRFTGITDGASRSVVSEDGINLASFLLSEGFSKADVVSARVQSAEIRILFPQGQNLSVFEAANLQLRTGGEGGVSVASSSDLANARNDALTVSTGRDIATLVQAPSFEGLLQLVGAANLQDDFEVTVNLTIAVDVEGL
jgi:hypothetical protein